MWRKEKRKVKLTASHTKFDDICKIAVFARGYPRDDIIYILLVQSWIEIFSKTGTQKLNIFYRAVFGSFVWKESSPRFSNPVRWLLTLISLVCLNLLFSDIKIPCKKGWLLFVLRIAYSSIFPPFASFQTYTSYFLILNFFFWTKVHILTFSRP